MPPPSAAEVESARLELAPIETWFREGARSWQVETARGANVSIAIASPVILTSIVNQLDPARAPLVVFTIAAARARSRARSPLRLSTSVEGYSSHVVDTITPNDGIAVAMQLPTFWAEALRASEATAATLHVEVACLASKITYEKTFPVRLLARTTGHFAARYPPAIDDPFDPSWLAAFVTPNDDAVIGMLREVAACHPDDKLAGESRAKTPRERAERVTSQVKAAFRALRERGLAFVDSRRTNGIGREATQRIRLPRETLAARCGNCADRTVLLASLLEAMGLTVGLGFVDGHTFVAYRTGDEPSALPAQPREPGDTAWDYVDATLLETVKFEDAREIVRRNVGVAAETSGARFTVLSLPELRARGVLPMA